MELTHSSVRILTPSAVDSLAISNICDVVPEAATMTTWKRPHHLLARNVQTFQANAQARGVKGKETDTNCATDANATTQMKSSNIK